MADEEAKQEVQEEQAINEEESKSKKNLNMPVVIVSGVSLAIIASMGVFLFFQETSEGAGKKSAEKVITERYTEKVDWTIEKVNVSLGSGEGMSSPSLTADYSMRVKKDFYEGLGEKKDLIQTDIKELITIIVYENSDYIISKKSSLKKVKERLEIDLLCMLLQDTGGKNDQLNTLLNDTGEENDLSNVSSGDQGNDAEKTNEDINNKTVQDSDEQKKKIEKLKNILERYKSYRVNVPFTEENLDKVTVMNIKISSF